METKIESAYEFKEGEGVFWHHEDEGYASFAKVKPVSETELELTFADGSTMSAAHISECHKIDPALFSYAFGLEEVAQKVSAIAHDHLGMISKEG